MGVVASISDRVGDLGAYLREQRENARLSVRQLASLTGVSNPYLSQVERGLRRPSAEVLQQLAKGLRISAEALYVRAGILDDGPRGTVEAAVEADEGLTSRQKKVLLELCAHFRSENARAETTQDGPEPESTPTKAPTRTATKTGTKTAAETGARTDSKTRTKTVRKTADRAATTTAGKTADRATTTTGRKTAGRAATKTATQTAAKTATQTAAKTASKTAARAATKTAARARTTAARMTARTKASTSAPTNAHPENGAAPSSR